MSDNYYALFRLGDSGSDGQVIYRMHIGKGTWSGPEVGYGISTFSGKHFPTVAAWIQFLRHNTDCITIVNETEDEQDIESFIEEMLLNDKPTSDNQIQWLRENHAKGSYSGGDSLKIWDTPQPDAWRARYWIDPDTGKLFYNGYFS